MKVPDFTPVSQSEVPEMPEWMERPLAPIHRQLEKVTDALQTGLSVGDNFEAETRSLKLLSGKPAQVKITALDKAKPAKLLSVGPRKYHESILWKVVDLETIEVTAWFNTEPDFSGTTPADEVDIILVVMR